MKTKKEFLIELIEKNEAEMNDISVDFVGDYIDNESNDIYNDIAECSDNNVPIYYSDKEEWLRNNGSIDAIEDSVKEYGVDSNNFSFWGMIDQAIYYQNYKALMSDFENIIDNAILFNILAILEENGKENESIDGSFVITISAMQYDPYSANYWDDVKQFAKGVYSRYIEGARGELIRYAMNKIGTTQLSSLDGMTIEYQGKYYNIYVTDGEAEVEEI